MGPQCGRHLPGARSADRTIELLDHAGMCLGKGCSEGAGGVGWEIGKGALGEGLGHSLELEGQPFPGVCVPPVVCVRVRVRAPRVLLFLAPYQDKKCVRIGHLG